MKGGGKNSRPTRRFAFEAVSPSQAAEACRDRIRFRGTPPSIVSHRLQLQDEDKGERIQREDEESLEERQLRLEERDQTHDDQHREDRSGLGGEAPGQALEVDETEEDAQAVSVVHASRSDDRTEGGGD